MIVHPIVLVIMVVDGAATLLLCRAAYASYAVVRSWSPESASAQQLRLESRFETAAILTRATARLLLLSTLLLLVALSSVLPDIIPGAMCGTGVLASMHGLGVRALLLRAFALAALGAWYLVDHLDRSHPRSPLALPSARTILLALPLVILATVESARALTEVDSSQPTSCCTLVYERAQGLTIASSTSPLLALGFTAVGSAALVLLGGIVAMRRLPGVVRVALSMAAIALPWSVAAAISLSSHLSSYHYGVLGHECPWCLLLWEHRSIGYPLFASLAWVAFEGFAAAFCIWLGGRFPEVSDSASLRVRRTGFRVTVGALVYIALAIVPALSYRLEFGVWMHG